MQLQKFYPSIDTLVNLDNLPEELSFLKTKLETVLQEIYYDNLVVEKSNFNDTAFYKLNLLSKSLEFEILGTGFKLVINPNTSDFSSMPVTYRYSWKVLRFLKDFDFENFSYNTDSIFDLLIILTSISEYELVKLVLINIIEDETPQNIFVDNINNNYSPTESIPYPTSETLENKIYEILENFNNNQYFIVENISIFNVVFELYLKNEDNLIETNKLDGLFLNWIGTTVLEFIKEIIIPDISLNIGLSIGLEIPRSILIPFDPDTGEAIENTNSIVECDIGEFCFTTKNGITYSNDISFSLNYPAKITNTDFTIDFQTVKFDFSDTTNIIEAELDDREEFKGIYIESVVIGLPQILSNHSDTENSELRGYNILLGTPDGFSGKISLSVNEVLSFTFPNGLKLALDYFDVTFKHDSVIESSIYGTITVPAFKDENGEDKILEVRLTINNGFKVEAIISEGITVLNLEDVIKIDLYSFMIGYQNDSWEFDISSKITNQVKVPGIEGLLPYEINIPSLLYRNDEIENLDYEIKWDNLTISSEGGSGYFPIPNPNFIPGIVLEGIEVKSVNENNSTSINFEFVGAGLKIGPITAVIQGLGITANISPAESGNLGPVGVGLSIKYPTGIGISLETAVFTGGGFLMFAPDNHTYAGALELSFKGLKGFSLTAIGVLTTQMPDGSSGTSILIIITAVFPVAIPLSYNFFLQGVGGLLGLHRTINITQLQEKTRSGAIDNILFPTNVIENITTIISDIQDIFPAKHNQFIIGPMAKISFSNPPIIDLTIGLLIEFPNPVTLAILGVLKVLLPIPIESLALVKIKVAFVGVLSFNEKFISFDASLFDSRIGTFVLQGDMAVRLTWGAKKDFVLTVGGFHPSYKIPSHFNLPQLKRLSIIFFADNPRLVLSAYFALTSNTVQLGAELDFYFSKNILKKPLEIIGKLAFDVLFQFSPFYFIAEMIGALLVKWNNKTLMTINLYLSLRGPAPWKVQGDIEIKVSRLYTYEKSIDLSFGETHQETLPPIQVFPLVKQAIENSQNWLSDQPELVPSTVRLQEIVPTNDKIFVQANTVLVVSQTVAPLNKTISKFGNYTPSGVKKFDITEVKFSDSSMPLENVYDTFSPASYKSMSDKDKLKAPSFERMKNGVRVKVGADNSYQVSNNYVSRLAEYEVLVKPPEDKNKESSILPKDKTFKPNAELFSHLLKGNNTSKSKLSKRIQRKQKSRISILDNNYVIVNSSDYTINTDNQFIGSKSDGEKFYNNLISNNPLLKNDIKLVPEYEL